MSSSRSSQQRGWCRISSASHGWRQFSPLGQGIWFFHYVVTIFSLETNKQSVGRLLKTMQINILLPIRISPPTLDLALPDNSVWTSLCSCDSCQKMGFSAPPLMPHLLDGSQCSVNKSPLFSPSYLFTYFSVYYQCGLRDSHFFDGFPFIPVDNYFWCLSVLDWASRGSLRASSHVLVTSPVILKITLSQQDVLAHLIPCICPSPGLESAVSLRSPFSF